MELVVRGLRIDLVNADDCTSLSVQLDPAHRGELDELLRAAGLGSWDGGPEAEVRLDELRRLGAAADVGSDWPGRWEAMLRYAAVKGWISGDGDHVRAHIDIVNAGTP